MAQRRFSCPKCQHAAIVLEEQSGADWTCPACGARETLPTLMQMRRLERVEETTKGRRSDISDNDLARSRRSIGAGLAAIGILMALLCLAGIGVFWYTRSQIPEYTVDLTVLEQTSDDVMRLTPSEAYESWEQIRDLDLATKPRATPPHITTRQQRRSMETALAVCSGGIAVGVLLALGGGALLYGADRAAAAK